MNCLCIETSSSVCSVALTSNLAVDFHLESDRPMQHAALLGPYIEKCMDELARREVKLDAVAVSLGPGSYTGLRIGLSMAKGLCYAQDIPLIGIPTLRILASKAMFSRMDFQGDELIVPMIDARRMEVYAAVYDFALRDVMPARPVILDAGSFTDILAGHKVLFIGDGTEKARTLIQSPDAVWLSASAPLATDMLALAERAYLQQDFLDLAYSTPLYLKEYEAALPKNKVLGR